MSKIVKFAGKVAGVVGAIALIGTGIGAALGGTMMFTAFGASIAASTIATVAGAVSIGASLLTKRPKAPQTSPESIDRLNASIDPRTARKMIFGTTAMATDIRDQEYSNDQTYLHRFIVVAAHKVNAITQIWFDDKLAWTSSGGVQGEFAGYLTVTPVLEGSAGNAINIGPRMGSTRRFTGCAYVYLRYKLTGNDKKTDSPFAQAIPTRMTIRGNGAYVYDPRKDSTVPGGSGSHRANNQATWEWSASGARNPALQLLWYLLGWRINGVLSAGRGIPANRIDLESFITAANLCDESVALAAGGTEPRYRSDGIFSEADSPTTVLDNFKAAMNADIDDVGGKLRLTVFHNDLADPVADFGDDDMIDGFKWRQTPALDESFNVVRGSYTNPSDEALYQLVDYPQVEIASPDGIERADNFDLPLVQSPSQAQRLAKQRLQRNLYGGQFETVFNARGWLVQKNSVVRLSCSKLGWVHKLFRVAQMEHRQDGTCPVVLREEHAAIYAWDADEKPAVAAAGPTVYDYTKSPIYLGFEEIDQSGVKVVWKRAATQPATPSSSPGTPATWYDDVASVPAGSDPLWGMYGQRGDVASNYVWDAPYKAEGTDGAPGETYYTWYAYADADDGTFNFTTGAPGNRQYQGVAHNKTTATESNDPADYAWSDYAGPPNFGLAVMGDAVLAGNKMIKAGSAYGWDSSVYSTESYKGGASVSFEIFSVAECMVGLNTDPTTDAHYSSIDFALYISSSSVIVYESGSSKYTLAVAPTTGDVFTVTYNGKAVVYSKNGVPFYTNGSPGADLVLYLDSSLPNPNTQFGRILSFTAVGAAGADGMNGAPGLTISASPQVFNVARTATGAPKAGELPKPTQIKVYEGDNDVTALCTFTKTDTGCSVSNDGGGAFSLTALTAEKAYTVITATYGARSIPIEITVAQPRDGSAASHASSNALSMTTATGFVAIGSVDIVAAAGTTISGTGYTTYLATNTGPGTRYVRAEAKVSIQNLTDSGAEADGASIIGSAASYIANDGPSEVGSVSAAYSVTNTTGAPKTFRVRFYLRKYDGLANISTAGGTYAGTITAQVS